MSGLHLTPCTAMVFGKACGWPQIIFRPLLDAPTLICASGPKTPLFLHQQRDTDAFGDVRHNAALGKAIADGRGSLACSRPRVCRRSRSRSRSRVDRVGRWFKFPARLSGRFSGPTRLTSHERVLAPVS